MTASVFKTDVVRVWLWRRPRCASSRTLSRPVPDPCGDDWQGFDDEGEEAKITTISSPNTVEHLLLNGHAFDEDDFSPEILEHLDDEIAELLGTILRLGTRNRSISHK